MNKKQHIVRNPDGSVAEIFEQHEDGSWMSVVTADFGKEAKKSPKHCPYCGAWLAAAEEHKADCTAPNGPEKFCRDCGYPNPGPSHDFGCGDLYVA